MTTITKKISALLLALVCMTGASALAQSAAVSGAEHALQRSQRTRPGQAQDADGGGQLRCGDGGNGI